MGRSGGDVLIPVCCFQFCCIAGREHMFNDDELKDFLKSLDASDVLSSQVETCWRLNKGTRFDDIKRTWDYITSNDEKKEGTTCRESKSADATGLEEGFL